MRIRLIQVAAAAITILTASDAVAAPFCAVFAYGRNCIYQSMEDCQQSGGGCVINQQEVRAPMGTAPFCAVSSMGTHCMFMDAEACQQAASDAGGVCTLNPRR